MDYAYDPTIQALLDQCETDWGDPIKNRETLIPYGIKPIDMALYGIDPAGELIVVQGEEKNRKTTFVANVICNFMTWDRLKNKPMTNIDTLESGMRPPKYRDMLISIMATRYLISQGHRPHSYCPVCNSATCRELGISPKFLKYNTRTKTQQEAIAYARDVMNTWPLLIHGASIKQGNTRNLQEAALGSRDKEARWLRLMSEYGMQILVVDHGQQYQWGDTPTDYEKQVRSVSTTGDFVSQYGIACLLLSQVSLTSVREVKQGGGKLIAAGGSKYAQEANTVFSIKYKPGIVKIHIEESRDAGSFPVWQRIEDVSGTFYGDASLESLIEIA